MKTKSKIIIAALSILWIAAAGARYVSAQMGGGISVASLFRLVGTAVIPNSTSWTLGDSSNRIAGGYFTALDTSAITIEQPNRVTRTVIETVKPDLAKKYLSGTPMTYEEYREFVAILDAKVKESGGIRVTEMTNPSDLKIAVFNFLSQ